MKVTVTCYDASYDNYFGIFSPSPLHADPSSPQELLPLQGPADTSGIPIDIGNLRPGELEFYITTPENYTWYTGPASRNVDNFQHAH